MHALLVRRCLLGRMPLLTLTTTVRLFLFLNEKTSGEFCVQFGLILWEV